MICDNTMVYAKQEWELSIFNGLDTIFPSPFYFCVNKLFRLGDLVSFKWNSKIFNWLIINQD